MHSPSSSARRCSAFLGQALLTSLSACALGAGTPVDVEVRLNAFGPLRRVRSFVHGALAVEQQGDDAAVRLSIDDVDYLRIGR